MRGVSIKNSHSYWWIAYRGLQATNGKGKYRGTGGVHICFAAFSTNERCFAFLLVDGLPRYAKLPLERRWMRRQEAPLAIMKEARPSRLPVMLKVKKRVVLQ